ncbi:segregation and condensation protein A [Halolamina pelagica]|uniref:Segregation and condensation protein A n=2 Tax=Halolamina pelagica TaxID=699431 RepID=A0A0P7HS88_9EURY|nr:ScpA family protein [Halolamina pelagica]KPN29535.1 segregation and condensation protein A [Halolamina pelagica]
MSDEEFSLDLSSDRSAPERGEPGVDDDLVSERVRPDEAASADDGEVEPVEVLVSLAEEGEIDPWDIDIVAVTDAFLDELDEANLRASGRALFYASVLLRMKSDAMLRDDEPEEPAPEPWEVAMSDEAPPPGADDGFDPVDQLEAEMDRRLERKSTRGTPETLDELVRELRDAERGSWWKESRSYDTTESPRGYSRGPQTLDYHAGDDFRRDQEPTEADVTGTTHTEDIDEVIADVDAALAERYERGRDEVLFAEVRDAGGRPVMTYLALLFLSNRGDVRLNQDDLFGDLWVQDPDAVEAEGPGGAGVVEDDAETAVDAESAAGDSAVDDDADADGTPPAAGGDSATAEE